ncbi:MAG: hypothetical protein KGQ59_04615, partial [Bdellovibrionales bacterium]|nr:hypothetical protein [Bdellovibrionales bacterium]
MSKSSIKIATLLLVLQLAACREFMSSGQTASNVGQVKNLETLYGGEPGRPPRKFDAGLTLITPSSNSSDLATFVQPGMLLPI